MGPTLNIVRTMVYYIHAPHSGQDGVIAATLFPSAKFNVGFAIITLQLVWISLYSIRVSESRKRYLANGKVLGGWIS